VLEAEEPAEATRIKADLDIQIKLNLNKKI
jgi:hypothetical protein